MIFRLWILKTLFWCLLLVPNGSFAASLPSVKIIGAELKSIFKDHGEAVLLCGPDDYTPKEDLLLSENIFVGKNKEGVLIAGIDSAAISKWVKTLKTDELNSKLKEIVKFSSLFSISRDKENKKLILNRFEFDSSKVEIAQTYASCLAEGPKHFQCGSSNQDFLKGCCEGTSKFFGFEVIWKSSTPASGKWKIKYGHGNGMPVFQLGTNGKGEPLRFCRGARLIQ